MGSYEIGFILGSLRELMDVTREKLADGIMSVSSLSRLENGQSMPEKDKLEALFEKLGVNPNHLTTLFITGELSSRQKITDMLDVHLTNRNVEAAATLIVELEEMAKKKKIKKDKLFDKYILRAKIANEINAGKYDDAESIIALENAMRLHYPKYTEENIEKYYLTITDLNILNMLTILYGKQDDLPRAKKILYKLKENIETNVIDRIEKGRRYPTIIYNLTNILIEMEEYYEVIDVCTHGRKVCVDTGFLEMLPQIVANEASANLYLKNKEDGIRLFINACHALKLYKKYDLVNMIKNHAKEEHGIVLDKLLNPDVLSII